MVSGEGEGQTHLVRRRTWGLVGSVPASNLSRNYCGGAVDNGTISPLFHLCLLPYKPIIQYVYRKEKPSLQSRARWLAAASR
jgi:hypothetical protein